MAVEIVSKQYINFSEHFLSKTTLITTACKYVSSQELTCIEGRLVSDKRSHKKLGASSLVLNNFTQGKKVIVLLLLTDFLTGRRQKEVSESTNTAKCTERLV